MRAIRHAAGALDVSRMDEWPFDLDSDMELPDPLPLHEFPLLFDGSEMPCFDHGDSFPQDLDLDSLLDVAPVPGGDDEHCDDKSTPQAWGTHNSGSHVYRGKGSTLLPQSDFENREYVQIDLLDNAARSPSASGSPSLSSNTGMDVQVSCFGHLADSQRSQDKNSAICVGEEEHPNLHGKENDEVLLKKQIRLIRNRESASQSRQRRKLYIKDLEAKCRFLENECSQLQQRVSLSCTENLVLKGEITRLKKMKGSNGVAEPAVLSKDSLPLEFLSHLTCLCLLVELFRVAGLYLGLFMLVAHQILWRPCPRQNSWASEEAGGSTENHMNDKSSNYTALFTRRKRSFSLWRRRWRHNRSTLQTAI